MKSTSLKEDISTQCFLSSQMKHVSLKHCDLHCKDQTKQVVCASTTSNVGTRTTAVCVVHESDCF